MGNRLKNLESKLQGWMERANNSNHLLGFSAAISFLGTLTAGYPVTAVVMTAVMLAARRWFMISVACSAGSALAGAVIVGVAHFVGYNEIHYLFPSLVSVSTWNDASRWFGEYGIWTVFAVGASPLPQMPLLIFYGIMDDRIIEAFIALFAGKIFKYALIAWVTQHFPEKLQFFKRINVRIRAKHCE
jgi:membrane protein YqaA with SNARE-associated domain